MVKVGGDACSSYKDSIPDLILDQLANILGHVEAIHSEWV